MLINDLFKKIIILGCLGTFAAWASLLPSSFVQETINENVEYSEEAQKKFQNATINFEPAIAQLTWMGKEKEWWEENFDLRLDRRKPFFTWN